MTPADICADEARLRRGLAYGLLFAVPAWAGIALVVWGLM